MATIVRMPEIAANTGEALLATWLVAESTAVAATDPIATVETDKAAVDIEAEAAGVLLKTLVRAGRLRPGELEGGTLTVTNLGMYGTEEFAAIINPPQAAILAVGAARRQPVVRDGELAVGTVMHVTLSVDHRPVDGTVAAEWLRTFISLIENPLRILV